jgi:hypothetical protein
MIFSQLIESHGQQETSADGVYSYVREWTPKKGYPVWTGGEDRQKTVSAEARREGPGSVSLRMAEGLVAVAGKEQVIFRLILFGCWYLGLLNFW